eukprot:7026617-Pyramimonas_sp.AAC.1
MLDNNTGSTIFLRQEALLGHTPAALQEPFGKHRGRMEAALGCSGPSEAVWAPSWAILNSSSAALEA